MHRSEFQTSLTSPCKSVYVHVPTMSHLLGWGSQFFPGILRGLHACTVFLYHSHSLLFLLLSLFYHPVVLFLVLTHLFTSLSSRWPLAVSKMQNQSTLKGKICHHLTSLTGHIFSHYPRGSQNVLAVELFYVYWNLFEKPNL